MEANSNFKVQMQDEIINTCEDYKNGNIQLLEAVLRLRKRRVECESILKNIAAFEAEHYNEIELSAKEHQNEFRGAKFEFRNGRKTFDFSNIKEINDVTQKLTDTKSKYQTAWEMHQKGVAPVDADTGEVLELPTMKQGKSSMVVKL